MNKSNQAKLPNSIYVVFVATIIANALATYLIIIYLL